MLRAVHAIDALRVGGTAIWLAGAYFAGRDMDLYSGRTDGQTGGRAGRRDDCGWGKKIINEKRLGGGVEGGTRREQEQEQVGWRVVCVCVCVPTRGRRRISCPRYDLMIDDRSESFEWWEGGWRKKP